MSRVSILRERESRTVGELWTAYRSDRLKDGKVIINFDNDWKALKPRFETLELNAITADICRDYADARHKAGKSASTIWTELTRLRSCLNWAHKRRIIPTAPYVWVPTKPDGRQRVMSEEEVRALLDACKAPFLSVSSSARSTGKRL